MTWNCAVAQTPAQPQMLDRALLIMPNDVAPVPAFPPPATIRRRPLGLLEMLAEPTLPEIPIETNLGIVTNAAAPLASVIAKKWEDAPTGNPAPGDTEMWEPLQLH
jgi:hypothetical protein